MSQLITFHSVTKAVGKSGYVARTAKRLAGKGKNILVTDGYLYFRGELFDEMCETFNKSLALEPGRNLHDLLFDYKTLLRCDSKEDVDISQLRFQEVVDCGELYFPNIKDRPLSINKNVDYLPGTSYINKPDEEIDMKNFCENWHGRKFLQYVKHRFCEKYDCTLVDVPTGKSDLSAMLIDVSDIIVPIDDSKDSSAPSYDVIKRFKESKKSPSGESADIEIIPIRGDGIDHVVEHILGYNDN